jgi:hypothetical protein
LLKSSNCVSSEFAIAIRILVKESSELVRFGGPRSLWLLA